MSDLKEKVKNRYSNHLWEFLDEFLKGEYTTEEAVNIVQEYIVSFHTSQPPNLDLKCDEHFKELREPIDKCTAPTFGCMRVCDDLATNNCWCYNRIIYNEAETYRERINQLIEDVTNLSDLLGIKRLPIPEKMTIEENCNIEKEIQWRKNDSFRKWAKTITDSKTHIQQLTQEVNSLKEKESQWISITQAMPDKEHIKKRTEFLVRGYFQVGESKGDQCYRVCQLATYFADDSIVMFQTPSCFNEVEWMAIKD